MRHSIWLCMVALSWSFQFLLCISISLMKCNFSPDRTYCTLPFSVGLEFFNAWWLESKFLPEVTCVDCASSLITGSPWWIPFLWLSGIFWLTGTCSMFLLKETDEFLTLRLSLAKNAAVKKRERDLTKTLIFGIWGCWHLTDWCGGIIQ